MLLQMYIIRLEWGGGWGVMLILYQETSQYRDGGVPSGLIDQMSV